MFLLQNTIDDISPLITYSPKEAWSREDLAPDANWTDYWAKTKTWTLTKGSSATFHFNGTAISILGAKRSNHGNYSVNIDGNSTPLSGFASGSGEFQAVLFAAPDLQQGSHTVVISNEEDGHFLDIDCVQWNSTVTSGAGDDTQKNFDDISRLAQDTDPSLVYSPEGAWGKDPDNLAHFNGASGHTTSQLHASMNYTFEADAVQLFGSVGPHNCLYSIQVDDSPVQYLDAQREQSQYSVLLYQADNLGAGNHTLSIMNQQADKLLEIDYAVVYSLDAQQASNTTTSLPAETSVPPPPTAALGTGGIVGVSVAGVFVSLLVLLLWLLLRRNKTLWMRLHSGYVVQSQFDSSQPSSGSHSQQASSVPSTVGYGAQGGKPSHYTEKSLHDPFHSVGATYIPEPSSTEYNPYHEIDNQARAQPNRSTTMQTQGTASTLVADDGSHVSEPRRQLTLKLVPQWGTRGRRRDTPPDAQPRRNTGSSSIHRLLLQTANDHADFLDIGSPVGDSPIDLQAQTLQARKRYEEEDDLGQIAMSGQPSPPTYRQSQRRESRPVVSPRGPRPK